MSSRLSNLYDRNFYLQQRDQSCESAGEVVPHVISLLHPRRVVDVGCGVGTWLGEFQRQGVSDVTGIDGTYVRQDMLQIPPDRFRSADLSQPKSVSLPERFDLAVSLEVAEHLPAAVADDFVALLTSFAPTVLFSAAIPGQGGVNHINEQWPDYWISRFAAHGFQAIDCLRPAFWNNERVQLCYRQNMFLLTRDDSVRQAASQSIAHAPAWPLRLVHPDVFAETISRPPSLRQLCHHLPDALMASVRARLRRVSA